MRRHTVWCGSIAIGVAGIVAATACGKLLTEPTPSQVLSGTLNVPANAPLLVASTVADFSCAYAQYTLATGLVSDELLNAQLQSLAFDMDRRTMTAANTGNNAGVLCETAGAQAVGFYTPLSIARFDGDHIATLLKGWTDAQVPNRAHLLGIASTYTGYALTFMGETMCSGAIDGSHELTPDSLLGLAEARFTTAIASATQANDSTTLQFALLGRARERLDRGQAAAAAADARLIAGGFDVDATFSGVSPRTENRVYTQTWRDPFASIEGPFQHLKDIADTTKFDPRVQADSAGGAGQNGVAIFAPLKYPAINSPIPIAHWSEAQLIIAEADVDAGDLAGANAIVNTLQMRQGLGVIPPFPDSATAIGIIVQERSRELFLEGHRLADFIRYKLPLNPPPGAPYPFGAGGAYGSQLCFPLPNIERLNNPNIG